MFEFFKKDKTKKLIENRTFLTEMSGTELQTLLKIDFVYQKTKQKYSDVFITSNVQYDKLCSFITIYTFSGKPIVIDLLSLTTMQKYDDEIAKITDIRIANEREAETFLNNYLNYQWNDNFKKQWSVQEFIWQNLDRKREFENEDKLYLCQVGKKYNFLDENEKVVVGEVVATKTVRFGYGDQYHKCYQRMTGLQLKESVDLSFLPRRNCIHCVSVNHDENIGEPFFRPKTQKILDNEEVVRVRDEPIIRATETDDVFDLKEEYIVDSENLHPEKGKCYYYVVSDGSKKYVGKGFFDKESYGVFCFHNANKISYINPKNIVRLTETDYEPYLKKLDLSERVKIVNRYGETFFGTGASASVDEDGFEIITLANGQFNDKLSNVVFIYTRKNDNKQWKLVWHK